MSDNGAQAPAKPKIPWLKGHLRDAVKASECVHLHPTISAGMDEILQPVAQGAGAVLTPDAKIAVRKVKRLVGAASNSLVCDCPALIERWRESLVDEELRPQLEAMVTTLDFCRLCPFWERAQ